MTAHPRRPSRRDLLRLGLLTGASVTLPVGATFAKDLLLTEHLSSPPVPSFAVPLRIPPVLAPVRRTATTDHYVITQREVQLQIIPGLGPTTLWSYNGSVPGPTITASTRRNVRVRHRNALHVPTSTHLHGADVPADSDGHPLDLVEPGQVRDHFYPGGGPAVTMWYHDHAIHETGRNVYMGLAGVHPVSSPAEESLGLPRGRYDVPLVIQDKFFLADGSIAYPRHDAERPMRQGVFGDVLLVNGTPKPFFRVSRRKYRFRIVDGSNACAYRLSLSTGEPLVVIGNDGGLLPRPVPTATLEMGPAERYDIVVDFAEYPVGTRIVLRNTMDDVPGNPFDPALTREVMRFDVVADAVDDSRLPSTLVPLPADAPRPSESVRTRRFRFDRTDGGWSINGRLWDPNRIDARPRLGTVETWVFENGGGGWWHPIHPHLIKFRPLSRTRRPLATYESAGLKDTLLLRENEAATIIIRWKSFAGRYVMHCHNVEHEDHDMMMQFETVR